jgi:hypothetical protein
MPEAAPWITREKISMPTEFERLARTDASSISGIN